LIDFLCGEYATKLIELDIELDLSKLVVSGQSFGGATALRVGRSDPRAKAVLTMDPWFMPLKKEVVNGEFKGLKQPMFFVNTERFRNIAEKEHQNYYKILKEGCENFECITMLDCEHHHQNDTMCLHPFELELPWFFKSGKLPKSYNHLLVQTHAWLHLSFLHRIGFNKTFDPSHLEK
jgi:dienelactone hydrolase